MLRSVKYMNWPSDCLSCSTAWPDRCSATRCKRQRTAPSSHVSSPSSVSRRARWWGTWGIKKKKHPKILKNEFGLVKTKEELYHIELCDHWRFLDVTANRVLDVLDGHLISLSRIEKKKQEKAYILAYKDRFSHKTHTLDQSMGPATAMVV